MKNKLNRRQSFDAMEMFLELYFKKTSSDSLGALLSCMQFLDDGKTADSALWENWKYILGEKQYVTSLEAFRAMRTFLNKYYVQTSSKNIKKLLKDIDDVINSKTMPEDVWNNWTKGVTVVLKKSE